MSSFRLSSPDQIRVLREIGLQSVRYIPAKSTVTAANAGLRSEEARDEPESDAMVQAELGAADLLAQFNARQQHCNLRFQEFHLQNLMTLLFATGESFIDAAL